VHPEDGPLVKPPTLLTVALSYENSFVVEPVWFARDIVIVSLFIWIPELYFIHKDDSDNQTEDMPREKPAHAVGEKLSKPNPIPSIVILREPLVAKLVAERMEEILGASNFRDAIELVLWRDIETITFLNDGIVIPLGNFEIKEENETHKLNSPREGNENEWEGETEKMPNFAPKMDKRTAPVQGNLALCVDDRTPGFGNMPKRNEDICLENETSTFDELLDTRADADLHAKDDSESHFEFSQELRPNLAFTQKLGASPKLADKMVIEELPDDSKTSVLTFVITTLLKLKSIAEGLTDSCSVARTWTAATTWAWELLPTTAESESQTWARIAVPPDRTAPVGSTTANERPSIEIDTQPLDGPFAECFSETSLMLDRKWLTRKDDTCWPTELNMATAFTPPEENLVASDETLVQKVDGWELTPEEILEEPLKIPNELPCTSTVTDPEGAM
jgi:hypothetical protein